MRDDVGLDHGVLELVGEDGVVLVHGSEEEREVFDERVDEFLDLSDYEVVVSVALFQFCVEGCLAVGLRFDEVCDELVQRHDVGHVRLVLQVHATGAAQSFDGAGGLHTHQVPDVSLVSDFVAFVEGQH